MESRHPQGRTQRSTDAPCQARQPGWRRWAAWGQAGRAGWRSHRPEEKMERDRGDGPQGWGGRKRAAGGRGSPGRQAGGGGESGAEHGERTRPSLGLRRQFWRPQGGVTELSGWWGGAGGMSSPGGQRQEHDSLASRGTIREPGIQATVPALLLWNGTPDHDT